MAITAKEAIKIAKTINPNVNRMLEYKDAFSFENTKAGFHIGGNDSFTIMKDTGSVVSDAEYLLREDRDRNPKRVSMSSKVKRTKK